MSSTTEIQGALAAVSDVYEDRFTDFAGTGNYLDTQRAAEIVAMQNDGVEIPLPQAGDEPSRNWMDDSMGFLGDMYRDVAVGYISQGLKETVATMKATAAAMPTATAGEKFGAWAAAAAQGAMGTAEDAARYLRGAAYFSYGFMGVGVAHKAVTEGWDAGAQEAFKSAGGVIGMELSLAMSARAPGHPLVKLSIAAFVGGLMSATFDNYYDEVLSDIIQEAIDESWTQGQLEDAINAASKGYVDGKLDGLDDWYGDLLDNLPALLSPLGDIGPENNIPSPLAGPAGDALSPWGEAPDVTSPLAIDLDLDGVELTSFNSSTTATFFDIDGDGFAEQTSWIGPDDGLLARDLDDNGRIDSVDELFGSPGVDGFALLSLLDDNGDHLINQYDDVWADLVVWKDDGDAITESGELHSLSSLNIVSFDLAGVTPSSTTIAGNPISHTSTYTLSGGSTGTVADVWFVNSNVNTRYDGEYTLDIDTLSLPTWRGSGVLADLHIAMSSDGDLLELVQDFVANWNISRFDDGASLDADINEIMWTWAGVEGVSSSSRGSFIDARKLEFMEHYFGNDFLRNGVTPDPYTNAAAVLDGAYSRISTQLKAQLIAQSGGHTFLTGKSVTTYSPAPLKETWAFHRVQSMISKQLPLLLGLLWLPFGSKWRFSSMQPRV